MGLQQCTLNPGRLPNSSALSKAGLAPPVPPTCYPGNLPHKVFAAVRIGMGGRSPPVGISTSYSDIPGPASEPAVWTRCVSGLGTVKGSLKSYSSAIVLLSCMPQVWGLTGKTKFQSHYCGPEPASCNYSNISC